jgi:DNA-binding transcriptional MocR family regulator
MAGIQVRDMRRRDFFMCDNAIIDTYGRRLGPYALSVYVALLRHADQRTQSCYPSHKTLADKLGMSRDSVMRAIDTLKKAKLISVKHRKDKAGDAASNLYLIREVVAHSDHLDADSDHGSRSQPPPVVVHSDTNKTQLDKTHQQEHDGLLSHEGDEAAATTVEYEEGEAEAADPEADWKRAYDALYGRPYP